MSLLIVSFLAGGLTVAAPCILPLLPVVIGGSVASSDETTSRSQWLRPAVIALSLSLSVIVFTLLLKASTALLGIPTTVWQTISGVLVIGLGLLYLFPKAWSQASSNRLVTKANSLISSSRSNDSLTGVVVTGAALGPVFNSCSPTYLLIVATVLPVSLAEGLGYLVAYATGLGLALLLVAYLGQRLVSKLGWLSSRWFELTIGVLFVLVGASVILGLDKQFQEFVLDQGWYAPVSELETSLR